MRPLFFEKYKVKVTFYLSYLPLIPDEEWPMIHALRDAGHTIAFHGTYHLDAREFIPRVGCKKFMEVEIWPGMEILKQRGFDDIHHYAYPHGNENPITRNCLSKYFDTLRTVGFRSYKQDEIKSNRYRIKSFNLAKIPLKKKDKNFNSIKRLAKTNRFFFTHMHRVKGKELPVTENHSARAILKKLFLVGNEYGIKFLSMEEFNGL